jgi:hypothetical protein
MAIIFDSTALRAIQTAFEDAMHGAVRGSVQKAAEEGAAEAKRVGQFKDRTGRLRGSIRARRINSDLWEIVAGGDGVNYALFVEAGTNPHEIWPKAGAGSVGPLRAGQSRKKRGETGSSLTPRHSTQHNRWLRWYTGNPLAVGDNNVHFARMVHHPGTKPYPFMGPALLKAERVIEREVTLTAVELDSKWQR